MAFQRLAAEGVLGQEMDFSLQEFVDIQHRSFVSAGTAELVTPAVADPYQAQSTIAHAFKRFGGAQQFWNSCAARAQLP